MTELISGMPVLPLTANMQVKFEAVDPTTGAAVAGVLISNAVLYATDSNGPAEAVGDIGPMMFVPGPTPVTAPPAGSGSTGGASDYPGAH